MTSNIAYFLLAALAGFAVDLLYAQYVVGVSDRRVWLAISCSMGIGACSILGVTSVLSNGIPAFCGYLLGLGLGTLVGVKYG